MEQRRIVNFQLPLSETIKKDRVSYTQKFQLLLLIFLGTGLALAFSLSYSFSIQQGRNVGVHYDLPTVGILTLFVKQIIATLVGIVGLFLIQKISTKHLRHYSILIALLAIVAMFYTFLFAPEINGVRRWIRVLGVSVQTGDFARLALIIYLSNLLAQYNTLVKGVSNTLLRKRNTKKMFLFLFFAVLLYGGMLYLQGDFSSLLIFLAIIMALVFSSDLHSSWKVSSLLVVIFAFSFMVFTDPVRMLRVFSFLNPNVDLLGGQFQLEQSYDLIRSGGILGKGLGSSMLDVLLLPYFNNDFVFSIILNELGIPGICMVLGLYWMLCFYCFKICSVLFHTNKFYYFLTLSCVLNLVIAALGHIMVVLGFVPTAGLNLPFFSTGGTSLITSLLTFAFFLKAAKKADAVIREREAMVS